MKKKLLCIFTVLVLCVGMFVFSLPAGAWYPKPRLWVHAGEHGRFELTGDISTEDYYDGMEVEMGCYFFIIWIADEGYICVDSHGKDAGSSYAEEVWVKSWNVEKWGSFKRDPGSPTPIPAPTPTPKPKPTPTPTPRPMRTWPCRTPLPKDVDTTPTPTPTPKPKRTITPVRTPLPKDDLALF